MQFKPVEISSPKFLSAWCQATGKVPGEEQHMDSEIPSLMFSLESCDAVLSEMTELWTMYTID